MDLKSESSVLASANDSEKVHNLGNVGDFKVHENGFREVENNDHNKLLPDVNGKPEVSPSPTKVRKGYGLKKWRRIRRDVNNGGESSEDTGKTETRELQNSVVNPSKRMQFYADRPQKSEDSVSFTNAVIGGLDVFALLGDSGLGMVPSLDAGTDSENSEDRSSKSSTAASFPKVKPEMPVVVGFPHDKSRMRSLSGKNLTHSVHRGQQGKGRIEAIKKAKGERVKIEKENSVSSIESDSRSSNFVFSQGTHATSNGFRSERSVHHNGENGDEIQGNESRGGYSRDGEGGYGAADLSWEIKKDRSENDGSSSEQDPLAESIFLLQTVQEALEKEVLKFKEISVDASVDDSDSDTHTRQSELVETESRVYETELEELFKQRIEAEVEYLTISRTVQNLRVAAANPYTILEEQKAPASEQHQMLDNLGNEAEKLAKFSEDIASADETMKLQKRVLKYTLFFLLQIFSFLIILKVLVFEFSPNPVDVVPT